MAMDAEHVALEDCTGMLIAVLEIKRAPSRLRTSVIIAESSTFLYAEF